MGKRGGGGGGEGNPRCGEGGTRCAGGRCEVSPQLTGGADGEAGHQA